MEHITMTEAAIEDLVQAMVGAGATMRERRVCREALRGLVRLARSEQLAEIRASTVKLTGPIVAGPERRQGKVLPAAQRFGFRTGNDGQAQLEFDQG